tara:strand:+ start:64 stop:870 length:807 start_codon:yes stop_codon:yes gene_type:complete
MKQDNRIFDKKEEKELNKHRKNFYSNMLLHTKRIKLDENKFKLFDLNHLNYTDMIFKVNIKKFSGFEGHYYYNGKDSLVNTAIQLIKNINLKPNECYLFEYFNNFQPKTYGDVYGLNKTNKLHTLEQTNHFHPWIHRTPTNSFRAGLFGPKDITCVEHRMIRLKNLINNINKYEYHPSNDDIIEGYILLKNDDYRFLITGGHHRIAVLTAMHMMDIRKNKYDEILVKYEQNRTRVKIVRESDVENWSGVKSGWLSKDDALEMFNSYFK